MGYIKDLLYGKDTKIEDLTQEQKENLSALAQLASGLAVAGSVSDIGTAVAGSKNAVENNSLTGDKIQQNTSESAEYWKDKARETLGENAASLIINTAITVAAEGMSGTVGMADTAHDILAALVTCSTGDSYCTQAKADLNKVNDKIGGAFDAVMGGDAWKTVNQTITAANNGDQKAQENIAALLASILAPSKVAGSIGKPGKLGTTGNKVENIVSDASNANKIENGVTDAGKINADSKLPSNPNSQAGSGVAKPNLSNLTAEQQ